MPKLISNTSGSWIETETENDAQTFATQEQFTPGDALQLSVDSELEVDVTTASLIAIEFPAFNDGRGLSLAVLIRRAGFAGELRATGAVHQDLFHYMVRCGFSSIALPEGVDAALALRLIEPYSDYYQASVINPAPAYQRGQRG